jgi:hypothetical protein
MTLSLTSLIASAKASVAAKASGEAAKAKVKTARSTSEREDAERESKTIQDSIDWIPQAVIFRCVCRICTCRHIQYASDGLYLYYEHRRLANSTRLLRQRPGIPLPSLPHYTLEVKEEIDICHSCAAQQGFPFRPLPQLKGSK